MTQFANSRADSATALKCDLAGEVLRSFGPLQFPSVGWSMLPTIRPADLLVVEPIGECEIFVGEVIVAGRRGQLCAHRVIAVERDGENGRWITQGDGLPLADPPVAAHELLGRVRYLIRAGKLVEVPAKLSGADRIIAGAVRRSTTAARVFVTLHQFRSPQSSLQRQLSSGPVASCPS
jgi:hypothetical protein